MQVEYRTLTKRWKMTGQTPPDIWTTTPDTWAVAVVDVRSAQNPERREPTVHLQTNLSRVCTTTTKALKKTFLVSIFYCFAHLELAKKIIGILLKPSENLN